MVTLKHNGGVVPFCFLFLSVVFPIIIATIIVTNANNKKKTKAQEKSNAPRKTEKENLRWLIQRKVCVEKRSIKEKKANEQSYPHAKKTPNLFYLRHVSSRHEMLEGTS